MEDSSRISGNFLGKDCADLSQAECTRYYVLFILSALTLLVCVVTSVYVICVKRRLHRNSPFLILAVFSLEMVLYVMYYVFPRRLEFKYAGYLVRNIGYTLISFFFCDLAGSLLNSKKLSRCVLVPLFTIICLLLAGSIVVCYFQRDVLQTKQGGLSWTLLSGIGFGLNVLFLAAGLYISCKMRSIGVAEGFRRKHNSQLWGLIVVNFLSATLAFAFDLMFLFFKAFDKKLDQNPWWSLAMFLTWRVCAMHVHAWAAAVTFLRTTSRDRSKAPRVTADDHFYAEISDPTTKQPIMRFEAVGASPGAYEKLAPSHGSVPPGGGRYFYPESLRRVHSYDGDASGVVNEGNQEVLAELTESVSRDQSSAV